MQITKMKNSAVEKILLYLRELIYANKINI